MCEQHYGVMWYLRAWNLHNLIRSQLTVVINHRNSPWGLDAFNLPLFGDWWQHKVTWTRAVKKKEKNKKNSNSNNEHKKSSKALTKTQSMSQSQKAQILTSNVHACESTSHKSNIYNEDPKASSHPGLY